VARSPLEHQELAARTSQALAVEAPETSPTSVE
jgi:hypothetical protein